MPTVIRLRVIAWATFVTHSFRVVLAPASPRVAKIQRAVYWTLVACALSMLWFALFFAVGFFFFQ